MNILVIKYQNYEERVLLNETFNAEDLLKIALNDVDYITSSVEDEKGIIFFRPQFVKIEEIIKGVTYNAFAKKPYTYHINFRIRGHEYKTKKAALNFQNTRNQLVINRLNNLVSCN